jgi:hypothetical protein
MIRFDTSVNLAGFTAKEQLADFLPLGGDPS